MRKRAKNIYIYHSREGKIKLTLTYVWIAVKYLPSGELRSSARREHKTASELRVYFCKKKKVEVLTTRGRMEFRNWREEGDFYKDDPF